MKRWWKLLLAAVLVLALVLAGLAWRQQVNLKAVRDALRYSQEELEQQLADNQQTIRDAVDAAPEVSVREVTDEERQALRDGTVTREELMESLLNTEGSEAVSEPPGSSTVPEQPVETAKPVELPKPAEQAYQRELSALIAKVYVLREEYTMALDDMYNAAKADYKALPKGKRTKQVLMDLAGSYLDRARALEAQCDDQMDEIVMAMEASIKANGGDMNLVDRVVYAYANEKSLKKAWYMSELEKKGLV